VSKRSRVGRRPPVKRLLFPRYVKVLPAHTITGRPRQIRPSSSGLILEAEQVVAGSMRDQNRHRDRTLGKLTRGRHMKTGRPDERDNPYVAAWTRPTHGGAGDDRTVSRRRR